MIGPKFKNLTLRVPARQKAKSTAKAEEAGQFFNLFPDDPAGDGTFEDLLDRNPIANNITKSIVKSDGQIKALAQIN